MPPKLLITILLFSSSIAVFAQDENPFKSIGKKGKYEESFDQNDVQQIGTALVYIRTMKVVKLLEDKDESSRLLDNSSNTRFLSVDPLAGSYPMLTPYQYCFNRPIDGKDIDGLEYGTVNVTVNVNTGENNTLYVPYDATQMNVNGPLGRGVTYNIQFYSKNASGLTTALNRDNFFYPRNATKLGLLKTEYGNYMGATSFYTVNKNGDFNNSKGREQYFYGIPAVDAVDQAAKMHDIGYDRLNAVGPSGLFEDWGTTPVDEAALKTWNNFLGTNKVGGKDALTGQKITSEEISAASNASILFSGSTNAKKFDIANFMSNNYAKEAKSTNVAFGQDKIIEANYQLFLQKYMSHDKDGNWRRVDKMWSQDNDGNWTPNKPKK